MDLYFPEVIEDIVNQYCCPVMDAVHLDIIDAQHYRTLGYKIRTITCIIAGANRNYQIINDKIRESVYESRRQQIKNNHFSNKEYFYKSEYKYS